MDRLRFGTAGVPHGAKTRGILDGIRAIRELDLDSLEVEFVRGVKMGPETAREAGALARETGVVLTAHGPYYINLNSLEKAKREASRERVLQTARVGHMMGAYSITFHAAFFMKQDPEKVYGVVRDELKAIMGILNDEGVDVWVRPELSGKPVQFGSVEEIVRVSEEVEGVLPCVDFSHNHARSNGGANGPDAFGRVLSQIEDRLGKDALREFHGHVSGINYGPKGEKNHLNLPESDLDWRGLLGVLADYDVRGVLTCESPNLEGDAALLKANFPKR